MYEEKLDYLIFNLSLLPAWNCIPYFVHPSNRTVFRIQKHTEIFSYLSTAMAPRYGMVTKKALWKWSHFEQAKLILKTQLASWFLVYFLKRFRSLNTAKIKSVAQRALKLLAVKVVGLKKKSAAGPGPKLTSRPGFEFARGRTILKVLWPATLQVFDLQISYF